LVNVDASKITSGVIGNIDTSVTAQTLAFINAANGEAVRSGVKYAGTGFTYAIDGAAQTSDVAKFEAEISEGDSLSISGNVFTLSNAAVQGAAQAINKQAPVRTQLRVGVFGDDPASSTNDLFSAESGDAFSIPGTTATDYATFNSHLTAGDTITYKRTAGTETYTLVDQAPANQTGQATSTMNKSADLNPLNDGADGGSFTLATATGSSAITYDASGVFMVNGNVSNETNFENGYSAGDTIVFRAADALSGTSQRIELTDANLSGPVKASTINTADGPTGNTYDVLAQNGTTTLATISYADGADLYKVNGADAVLADFETQLSAIKAGTKNGTMVMTISGANQIHSLTTTAAS
ncbi:MAG: putative cell wall binding repeat 2, partial [Actinomycetia bacterium]|nr:putative cell wall binding repeat 2 [Actinomycetes bacterium]